MWDDLFASVDLLQQGLSASWTRNAVIRNNIANVETPGFKSSEVVFESLISTALSEKGFVGKTTREQHYEIGASANLEDISAQVVQVSDTSMRMDENNVDIESENAALAENTILYNTLMEKLNSELSRIKMAVTEAK